MQFVIRAYDGKGMLNKRMEVRPQDLKGMGEMRKHVIWTGVLLDVEVKMKGAMLVMV